MDARERWQALQAKLTIARARLEQGDRIAALEAVEAALALDPDFLAAHALRDRIRTAPIAQASSVPPATAAADNTPHVGMPVAPSAVVPAPVSFATPVPMVSTERYASFEQRARRRRVDGRLDAARDALARGRVRDAESALEEVLELDPNVPDLPELMATFDALRRRGSPFPSGRWVAAAATFLLVVVGATSMQKVGGLVSTRAIETAPPERASEPSAAPPSVTIQTALAYPVATVGASLVPMPRAAAPPTLQALEDVRARDVREALIRTIDTRPVAAVVTAVAPSAVSGVTEPISPPIAPPMAPAVVAVSAPVAMPVAAPPPVPTPPPMPTSAPNAALVSSTIVTPNDEVLVKQVLQRYRTAYEGLDARSARAVWPAVNESALARAFDGLESQSLTFENCNVSLNGAAAAATCRGSARYVPKVGSHEPRTESRTWNFTLRKNGPDWTIESARAQR